MVSLASRSDARPYAQERGHFGLDARPPDLIVQPVAGTIYTNSGAKVAEHGGFTADDNHVALLVVDGGRGDRSDNGPQMVDDAVDTAQIAPTILRSLGLDPSALDAVRLERTKTLPGSQVRQEG
jgi:hypothetical protein